MLAFVGVKMVTVEIYKIPIAVSLAIVAALIIGSIIVSLWWPKKADRETGSTHSENRNFARTKRARIRGRAHGARRR